MAYDAELQMLREFFLLHAPEVMCEFCHQPIYISPRPQTFGHRRHGRVATGVFTVHHADENRDNNTRSNLKDCHPDCHRRFHKALLIAAGKRAAELEKGGDNGQRSSEKRPEETQTEKVVLTQGGGSDQNIPSR